MNKILINRLKKWLKKFSEKIDLNLIGSEREKSFCIHYLNSFNATQAALKAGFPEDKAEKAGARLLASPSIINEIIKLRSAKALVLDFCEVEIIERYLSIAFSDFNDGKNISQIAIDGNKINIKLEDRLKALDSLADFYLLKKSGGQKAVQKKTEQQDSLKIQISRKEEDNDNGNQS